jgi:hypothetical protein
MVFLKFNVRDPTLLYVSDEHLKIIIKVYIEYFVCQGKGLISMSDKKAHLAGPGISTYGEVI